MNAFYTHQQYLIQELRKLDYSGPRLCLELGAGDGSASVFRGFLLDNPNLSVLSLDTSQDWRDQMMRDYNHPNYQMNLVDSWDAIWSNAFQTHTPYDIVFIDQTPFDARISSLEALKRIARIIILHDYDYFNKGICENIFSVGGDSFFKKYLIDFTLEPQVMILPPTLIMRNKNL